MLAPWLIRDGHLQLSLIQQRSQVSYRSKRNYGTEHIALNKLRGPAGVELRIFVSIPHPRPQLVCQPDLPEHLRDGRVLGVRLKGGQMQSTVSVGTIGVFCVEPIALDHKFCYIAAGVIPVGQAVGADLAQDAVSGANTLDAFLHKGVAEVFLAESDQPEKFGLCHRCNSPLSMLYVYFLIIRDFQALSNPF